MLARALTPRPALPTPPLLCRANDPSHAKRNARPLSSYVRAFADRFARVLLALPFPGKKNPVLRGRSAPPCTPRESLSVAVAVVCGRTPPKSCRIASADKRKRNCVHQFGAACCLYARPHCAWLPATKPGPHLPPSIRLAASLAPPRKPSHAPPLRSGAAPNGVLGDWGTG